MLSNMITQKQVLREICSESVGVEFSLTKSHLFLPEKVAPDRPQYTGCLKLVSSKLCVKCTDGDVNEFEFFRLHSFASNYFSAILKWKQWKKFCDFPRTV